MKAPYEELIQNAIKAPSGHNTQPWKFRVAENAIIIYPDYERTLPVVDSDNHALFISLGCALENLIIAAQHFGFKTNITYYTEQTDNESIVVQLTPSSVETENGVLFNSIDILVPGIGEIVGGSQREERLDVLIEKMKAMNIPEEELWWYLDTRRFGTVPHAGFGLGFERMIQFVTGMSNIDYYRKRYSTNTGINKRRKHAAIF